MFKKGYIVLIFLTISALFGCEDLFDTSHPDAGGINLTVDWSEVETVVPTIYRARAIFPSGFTRDFDNLGGTTNLLPVEPGEVKLYVYNSADFISVSGNKARVHTVNGSIAPSPGLFFSYYTQVFTEQDKDIPQIAVMQQQTGEMKFTFAIKPAEMIGKVKTVHAVLEGVASELDLQTNELSVSSAIDIPFTKNAYFATSTIRLLGFDRSTRQNLIVDVELENGKTASVTTDLTSLVATFNDSKHTLFSLNADLYISDDSHPSITVDQWERNAEIRYLSVFPSEIMMNQPTAEQTVSVITDQPSWVYDIKQTGNWIKATKSDYQLRLSVSANTGSQQRQATIHISAGGLSESIILTQQAYSTGSYADKEVVKLQNATVGKGVNIVMMGDGYTIKDMNKGTGKYEQDMRTAANAFFSVYPYTEYRSHFNVYMIAAISNQEGISVESPYKKVDTKFETLWEGGSSTGIDCNEDIVVDYLDVIADLEFADIHDITVIMPVNAPIYAGTCLMYYDSHFTSDYGNGFSICICPAGSYFEEIIIHEAGGHGFAKVTDEYVYYHDETIPDEDKNRVRNLKKYGWCENVDFYSNITQTSWKDFANLSKYTMVGTYEGARSYGKGIWTPEFNSCMNNNVPYYNAPSRWAIVRRIKRLAGFTYAVSQFLQDDKVPAYPATLRRYDEKDFIPLAPPVIKNISEIRNAR